MEIDQISDTTLLPLDKVKNKETNIITETSTNNNNKQKELNVNRPSDASENTIDITSVAFAAPFLSAEKFFTYILLKKYPEANPQLKIAEITDKYCFHYTSFTRVPDESS